ncbi:hypothetical protein CFOL_v3_05389 [Cephalotus follicularis]|uniref:Uncharacterized protein n=1 Tax=Cephalotus follicularis TaxID=3775 RepID=A0A1Q3B216_CEPFO|nr:hypothetical protein CFOL_v3_05389 [Cephalotus follicularis]
MAEKGVTGHSNRRTIRQPPSIPFLWEERPGMPKKDWKSGPPPVFPGLLLPPPKLIASVPFNWEEKPGTPLSHFSQPKSESATPTPPVKLIAPALPPIHSRCHNNDSAGMDGEYGAHGDDEQEWMIDLDLEAFAFESDEPFSSAQAAPSLLANCIVSSWAIATAIPVQGTSLADDGISSKLETPSSPASETDSSTNSYVTGTSSPVGAFFLESLFPLLPPNSGILEKVMYPEKVSLNPPDAYGKDSDCESITSVTIRRPPTLGELIMMSRRRSYKRKAVQIRKQNSSKDFVKRKAFGCCILEASIKMMEGLQKAKSRPRLKLV